MKRTKIKRNSKYVRNKNQNQRINLQHSTKNLIRILQVDKIDK